MSDHTLHLGNFAESTIRNSDNLKDEEMIEHYGQSVDSGVDMIELTPFTSQDKFT